MPRNITKADSTINNHYLEAYNIQIISTKENYGTNA
jgi:hypothetical protein